VTVIAHHNVVRGACGLVLGWMTWMSPPPCCALQPNLTCAWTRALSQNTAPKSKLVVFSKGTPYSTAVRLETAMCVEVVQREWLHAQGFIHNMTVGSDDGGGSKQSVATHRQTQSETGDGRLQAWLLPEQLRRARSPTLRPTWRRPYPSFTILCVYATLVNL
jgi:hypothetical protein